MSEYQYYEFQALDHPLSAEARSEMQSLSSRVQLTASSASFVYHYGGFRGTPYNVLKKYFDVMLYITNWGTRQLLFRFPANAISQEIMAMYQYMEAVEWSVDGKYTILNIELNFEDYGGWVEGEGLLPGIAQIQNDILRGDHRALYLAWLMIAHLEAEILDDDEDLIEPPVPPNMQSLSPALRNFIDFFEIDDDLVVAAAQASQQVGQPEEKLSHYIERLSDEEKYSFLARLLQGEANLDITLANRLRELSDAKKAEPSSTSERRGIRQLVALAGEITKQRQEEEQRKAQALHLKKMEKVAQQEALLWSQVPKLISQKQTKAYEEAITILKDLLDLAKHENRLPLFQAKIHDIRQQYPTLSGLHRRMKDAHLF